MMPQSKHRKKKGRMGITPEARARNEAKVKIMECLKDGEVTAQHILDRTGLSKVAAIDAMKALIKYGHIEQYNLFYFRKVKGQKDAEF